MKFTRIITENYPKLPYLSANCIDKDVYTNDRKIAFTNCHWGQLKLFYTELEFLEIIIRKGLDLSKCLILYVGAAKGTHIQLLLELYPMINLLLYDPNPFDLQESDKVIIKTGQDGFFDDKCIPDVIKIANGRKIIFITDIRLSHDDEYERQKVIYNDLLIQQRWAIKLNSEFMMYKFRMFYYKENPSEVDFINNNYINDDLFKQKTILIPKQNVKYDDMCYLYGDIHIQLYPPTRSGETRLIVSKIKYHNDSNKYSTIDQDKYKMTYYNNIDYESKLNYFNIYVRPMPYIWGRSDLLVKYIPGLTNTYTTAAEYYLLYRYLQITKGNVSFKDVLQLMIKILTFMNTHMYNDHVICVSRFFEKTIKKLNLNNMSKEYTLKYNESISILNTNLIDKKKLFDKQINTLKTTKLIDKDIINKFIQSYNKKTKFTNVHNGNMIIYLAKKI